METIEKLDSGDVKAECPFCEWSKEYDSVTSAVSGLRPHIQFSCSEASEEAQSSPSEYVNAETDNSNSSSDGSNSAEEEGDGVESDDQSSSSESNVSRSWDLGKVARVGVPLVALFFLVKSFFQEEDDVEVEEVKSEDVEVVDQEDDDHQLVSKEEN